jgi:hypothetical protein
MAATGSPAFVAIDLTAHDSLRLGYLLVMSVIVLVAKILGLFDRDELVIRKSTLGRQWVVACIWYAEDDCLPAGRSRSCPKGESEAHRCAHGGPRARRLAAIAR